MYLGFCDFFEWFLGFGYYVSFRFVKFILGSCSFFDMVVYYGEKFGKFEDFLCLSCYEMDRNNGFFMDYWDDDLCFGVLCDGEFCGGVLCDGVWYVGDMCDGVVYVSIVCDGILCDVFLFDEMRVSFVGLFFYGVCS